MGRIIDIIFGALLITCALAIGLILLAGTVLLDAEPPAAVWFLITIAAATLLGGVALVFPPSRWRGWIAAAAFLLFGVGAVGEYGFGAEIMGLMGLTLAVFVLIVAGAVAWQFWRRRDLIRAGRLMQRGENEEALPLLRAYTYRRPRDPVGHLNFAACLAILEDWEGILRAADRAEEACAPFPVKAPFSRMAYIRGVAVWRLGRPAEALSLMEVTLEQEPDLEALAVASYGLVLAELGRADEARQALAHAESLYPAHKDRGPEAERTRRRERMDELRAAVRRLDAEPAAAPVKHVSTDIRAERRGP
jgi:hypothetical protein